MKRKETLKSSIDRILKPLCRLLAAWGVSPNAVTFAGVLVTLLVPVQMLKGNWAWAGFWLLAGGFFDVLDGALAREMAVKRRFGAFWDSTLDRVSEAVVFAGFLLYYYRQEDQGSLLLVFAVFTLSFLVPYTRARAEGLGIDCEVGVLPRPGRVILLALGCFLQVPTIALALVGVLSLVTVLQRIHRVWVKTR